MLVDKILLEQIDILSFNEEELKNEVKSLAKLTRNPLPSGRG